MLIDKYLPADYSDSYSKEVNTSKEITPEMFLEMTFSISNSPWWVKWLMWLRNKVVAIFGLKTEGRLVNMILEQNLSEIVLAMDDKHLTFYVSLECPPIIDNFQTLKITTVVEYNNRLGRIYFMIIHPFHKVIVKNMLNRVVRRISKMS